MDANEIRHIIDEYAAFLESPEQKRLMRFFLASIPESLLPYPKKKIEEALDFYIQHFEAKGNREKAQQYINAKSPLMMYVEDATAIKQAYERLKQA